MAVMMLLVGLLQFQTLLKVNYPRLKPRAGVSFVVKISKEILVMSIIASKEVLVVVIEQRILLFFIKHVI